MKYQEWKTDFVKNRPNERLGQAFINDFYDGLWTDLFYTNDETKAQQLILDHLVSIQVWPNVPPKLDRNRYIPKQGIIS
jgi:hypothetical protein